MVKGLVCKETVVLGLWKGETQKCDVNQTDGQITNLKKF